MISARQSSSSPGGTLAAIAPAEGGHRRASSDDAASTRPPKRSRLACQECRQSKLRCGSVSRSDSCARCTRLGFNCVYDEVFRRINKRLKVQELTEEVQQLRSAFENTAGAATSQPVQLKPDSTHGRDIRERNDDHYVVQHVSFSSPPAPAEGRLEAPELNLPRGVSPPVEADGERAVSTAQFSQRLDNAVLNPSQIDRLFTTYFTRYHPHFPILDPTMSPDQCYSMSPALFWTIVGIASRRDAGDSTLMAVLAPSIRDLIFKAMGQPPHSRYIIKAMVVLCLWAFPTSSVATDWSHMLASMAKTSSMQVGLHRPEIVQDFSRVKIRFGLTELHDAIKTWVGCFIAGESITSFIGQSSLYGPDLTLDYLATQTQHDALPNELMALLQTFKFTNRVNSAMSNSDSSSGRLLANETAVLLAMLERDFEGVCSKLQAPSPSTEMLLLFVYLQFRCYHFFQEPGLRSRKEGLLKGYSAALSLSAKAHEAHARSSFFAFAPDLFHHSLTLAAMFIMKVTKSSYVSDINVSEAKKAFINCHAILRQMTLEDNDLPGRTAKIIEQLWHSDDSGKEAAEPWLKIKTRLGGSLLHDTLWAWREKFGGQKSRQPSAPQSPNRNTPPTQSAGADPSRLGAVAYLGSSHGAPTSGRPWDSVVSSEQSLELVSPVDAATVDLHNLLNRPIPKQTAPAPDGVPSGPLQGDLVPSEDFASSFDFALMPETYSDSYWETQLDGLMFLD